MNKVNSFFVAGLKFGQHRQIPNLKSGERIVLRANPDNEYDPNAIELLVPKNDHEFWMIGHVPRSDTYLLHAYRVKEIPLKATLFSYNTTLPLEKSALIVVESETILDTSDGKDIKFVNI